ncbi:hypothetical protein ACTMTF_40420 [Nonomuraea sp. ZG12]
MVVGGPEDDVIGVDPEPRMSRAITTKIPNPDRHPNSCVSPPVTSRPAA